MDDPETVLLIDCWKDQASLDAHHTLPFMEQISQLREKYDLHMKVERYIADDSSASEDDEKFVLA